MKKLLIVLASTLALVTLTFAQEGGPADPAAAARFKAMRPIFELSGRVELMVDLDAQPKLKFTKPQAKLLLPILKDLQTRNELKPNAATGILTKIEDTILTDAQLTWLDDTQLKRAEQRRQRDQNAGANRSGQPHGGGAGAGENGRAGSPDGAESEQSFNPFKSDRMSKLLATLIGSLSKR